MPTHLRLPAVVLHNLHWRAVKDAQPPPRKEKDEPARSISRHISGVFVHVQHSPSHGTSAKSSSPQRSSRPSRTGSAPTASPQHAASPEPLPQLREGADVEAVLPDVDRRSDAHVFAVYARHDPWLVLHKAIYLVLCIGWVSFIPFLPLFLASAGLSPASIGVILALRPLCILCATPVFGALADRGYRRVVLVGSLVVSSVLRAAIVLTPSLPAIGFLVLLGEALSAPIFSVLDAAILGVLEEGSTTANYGFTRVFGSIGWGAFAPVAGVIYDTAGAPAAFLTFLVCLCATAVLAWWLPLEHERLFQSRGSSEPPTEQAPKDISMAHVSTDAKAIGPRHVPAVAQAGDAGAGSGPAVGPLQPEELRPTLSPTSVDTPDCAIAVAAAEARSQVPDVPAQPVDGAAPGPGLRRLVSPDALLIFSTATIMGMLASCIGNFQFIFLRDLGASGSLLGLVLLFSILSEAPTFILSPVILRHVGTPVILAASLLGYAVRLTGYWALTEPIYTLPLELLHGITFALGWAALTRYVHDLCGHEHASTALSVLLALYSGVGAAFGGFFGGAIYATWGMRTLWATGAVVSVVALALLGVAELTRHLGRNGHSLQQQQEQTAQPPKKSSDDTAASHTHDNSFPDQQPAQTSGGDDATHAPPLFISAAPARTELEAAEAGADEEQERDRARSLAECGSPGGAGRRESLAALDDAAREAHATGGVPLLLPPPDAHTPKEDSAAPGSHAPSA